ncbi:general stress protein CsbA [Flavobacterium gossypii]|jgi:hypothetical protein|uniref:General stress protein CsbA n=1 Tax=Flavobacterium gossypii TaxID=1646119 RepID=A0ABR6DR92_9FLAO|nr:hypothetical protein [Flavobacterium gossypii]MBA9074200.1 general stress protein CsbA [Flavobacterium gossypii]
METNKYLNDITEIKNMMNRSSRFLSLSGLSGILAGVYCLIGAWLAYQTIYTDSNNVGSYKNLVLTEDAMKRLFAIAFIVILFSLLTGIILSIKKAKKENEKIWDASSKRLIINFAIPLATGGFFILFLIEKEIYGYVAPLTLIFYGLACVNASKYTLGDVRYLGITLIIIGLASSYFIGYGLFFWALGFGICHIFYGSMMYFKYEKN